MSRVLSIEVGYSITSVCEMEYKAKSPKVYNSFTVPTLKGVFNDDDVIEADTHYLEGLRGGFREHGIKAKQIVFSIASNKIATREVVIPYVKENRISDVVKANASDYFPLELSQYGLAYSIQEVLGEKGKGQQQYKLLVIAVPKAILDGYYKLAESLKMTVAAFDYMGNSIFQVVKTECTQGVHLVAKIDSQSTLVVVMKDQKVELIRNVPRGVDEALQAVMGSNAWGKVQTVRQAMDIVGKNVCIDLEMKRESEEGTETSVSEESIAKSNVTDALAPMIGGIARVIDYYTSRNSDISIERVLIAGIGADFLGMEELLHREIAFPVETIKKIGGLNLEKYFKDGLYGGYLSCIGATIAPIAFVSEKDDKKGSIEVLPSKNGMMVACGMIFAGGLLIAGALAGTSIFGFVQAASENIRLNTRIEELAEAETIYEQYLQQMYSYNKLTYFQYSTVTPNEELVAFMEEMEQKMPSSLNVQSFMATDVGVTMALTVENKEDAARLVQQFRTFETVGDVIVDSIHDSGAVMEDQVLETEPMVSFTITVAYKGSAAEAAKEELLRQAAQGMNTESTAGAAEPAEAEE